MRKIWAITWKDMRLRFSSRSEYLFFLILPLLFTTILGGLSFGSDGDNRIRLPVVNEDGGVEAQALLTTLADSGAVRTEEVARAEAETLYEDQDVVAMLVIPAGFSSSLQQGEAVTLGWYAQAGNGDSLAAEQAVRAAVSDVSRALAIANTSVAAAAEVRPFDSDEAAADFFAASLAQAQLLLAEEPARVVVTRPEVTESDSGEYDPGAQASAGQLITWVFIPLLGTSALFAYERTRGTLRRLLTTPTNKATYLLGTISGQLLVALVQMAILVGFGVLVMKLNWGQSPLALAVMLVSFGLAAVAMGTMLGTFIKSEGQANNLSIMLGMVMALMGGCWYPLELFPPAVQSAVRVLPTTWAMLGLMDLVLWGRGLVEILPKAGVLLGFALVFFVIGVRRFRYE